MVELKVIWTKRALAVFQKLHIGMLQIWEYNSLPPLQKM